jgi:alkanesulfonate monooxygenase SsuD/methylene tetrahydromethanopterin reductase-like flavin-dependent oxidoreductase (luciferase family)
MNVSGGMSMTTTDRTSFTVSWEENKRVAQLADTSGWEFLLPLGRWKGFGGKTNHNGEQFEVFTWASAITAITSQISVFATAHVPLFHPVVVAKQAATIDQIGGGRFGINIVAGWNEDEFGMFGLENDYPNRYLRSSEWLELLNRLWTTKTPFDFDGSFYSGRALVSLPHPVQQPRPMIVCAGMSRQGFEFAAANADFIFVAGDLDELREHSHAIRSLAAVRRRNVGVLRSAYVVCRDTEKEAQAYVHRYVDVDGDFEAAGNLIKQMIGSAEGRNSPTFDADAWRARQRLLVAGWGGFPLVGTAEQIVEKLALISEAGVDGVALGWVNYEEGMQQFVGEIQPLMEKAGLRVPASTE